MLFRQGGASEMRLDGLAVLVYRVWEWHPSVAP
jgi:hypothetical protein